MSTPEFRLLAACAVGLAGPHRDAAVRAAVEPTPDWPAFLAMIRRHRMAPIAVDALTCAGITAPSAIKAEATRDIRQALSLCAEVVRLQVRFAAEGIEMAVIKGPVLSQLLYGTPGLRQSKDLDVWVAPKDVVQAISVLQTDGYQVTHGPPAFSGPWLDLWLETSKDTVVHHPATGMIVELHHRLNTNPHLMATLQVADARRSVSVGAETLHTLGEEDLFSYLCSHGAVSQWFRLKWLADIQALLSGRSPEEITRLFAAARARGAGRAAGLALRLCRRLWNLPLPAEVEMCLNADRRLPWLERRCLNALGGPESPEGRFGWTASHFMTWWIKDSYAYRRRYLSDTFVDWEIMRRLPVPRPLHFLYPLLKPIGWLRRRLPYVLPQRP
jgi:hypothetical protein